MACTELSVIKNDEQLGDWFVDPMMELAHAVVTSAGRTWKK